MDTILLQKKENRIQETQKNLVIYGVFLTWLLFRVRLLTIRVPSGNIVSYCRLISCGVKSAGWKTVFFATDALFDA
jgi:hypothetical protein